jgi:hypothetical protein
MLAKSRIRIKAASLQHLDHVAAGQDYDRMTVVPYLPVGLRVDVRRGDQYAKLAVTQS